MTQTLHHKFVEYIPEELEEGCIYVSIRFATVVHRCCCGCGNEVVTPLSPTDWSLTFDGASITLSPSIGNWGFPCRSHYWVRSNRVIWAKRWSQQRIVTLREMEMKEKEKFYAEGNNGTSTLAAFAGGSSKDSFSQGGWARFTNWLTRRRRSEQ